MNKKLMIILVACALVFSVSLTFSALAISGYFSPQVPDESQKYSVNWSLIGGEE